MSEQKRVEPLMNQNRGEWNMPPSKHAPDEIRNSMFLPLMKKVFMGGIGSPDKTISAPPTKMELDSDGKKSWTLS